MNRSRPGCTCVHIYLLCLICFITISGCNGGSPQPAPTPPTPPAPTVSVTPRNSAIATGQTLQFAVATTGSSSVNWTASAGTVSSTGLFTAPSTGPSTTITVTATNAQSSSVSSTATVNVVAPGQVTATANAQVASYTIAPAAAANVSVQFGPDTNYGLNTWTQPAPSAGGAVSLFVAGMRANTMYHLRGVVQFADGSQYLDPDMTFQTGALPTTLNLPTITATTTAGATPQSGVELLDLVTTNGSAAAVAATDLAGNVIWSYNAGLPGIVPQPAKLIPNGHYLVNYSANAPSGLNSVLQEIDLTGKVIWQMTPAQLNTALAAATCSGCNITVIGTHHDLVLLPNGHLIVLASTQQVVSGTTVTGDVVIDLDQNHNPVWLWNEFDHLDINRRPYMYPDWTHTNAVLYSPDDGNLIISIRHQNWLVKIDYQNGAGAGDILWRLGYQGDFTLMGGTTPTDWFYAQHGPSFVSKNTTGKFTLAVFDNGDDRVFPSGVTCGTSGEPPCLYSTAQIYDIDETAKTATLTFNPNTVNYSFFGGNNAVLANNNVEYCESAGGPGTAGDIYEVTQDTSAATVWHMLITGQYAYRGQRVPSLYPGVQW